MAILHIPGGNRSLRQYEEIMDFLAGIGIHYERWEPVAGVTSEASSEQILDVYSKQINVLKRRGGYVTTDVIDVNKDTPGLDAMLAKFNIEHYHKEDEIRYIVDGRGLFHINPKSTPVVAIEAEPGDLIRVPRGTFHWFDLCGDRRIRAIRLFQDVSGWTPHYTHSEIDKKYEPVCWGPWYIQPQTTPKKLVSSTIVESQVHILLLDIEGTTTPVDFVYKTLFPYARRKLESFILEHFREAEIASLIRQLYMQHDADDSQRLQPPSWIDEQVESRLRSCIEFCKWLMVKDSKATPLKSLQGKIWEVGYDKGELQGEVYPDVPPALKRWRLQRREICIYSSGSVLSQQLLFHSIPSGDLTPLIAAFFDTSVGAKTETESYIRIAQTLTRSPHDFLFISDAVNEVIAANDAGMQAILCNRDAHASQSREPNIFIHSFDEILRE